MLTQVLMVGFLIIGFLIALPAILDLDIVKKLRGKELPLPPVAPMPTGPSLDDNETVIVSVPASKPTKAKLAFIVGEWEDFVDVLVENGMQESAEDMKTLLNKMCLEYRDELNEVEVKILPEPTPNPVDTVSIDSILVDPQEKQG